MPTASKVRPVEIPLDFESFYRSHYSELAQALYLLTGDRGEAEELAQEAMTRTYERWGRVRKMQRPVGYVYRTAMNLNRKRLRRMAVRARRIFTPEDDQDPAVVIEGQDEVRRLLARLPKAAREALILVEWLGLTPEEAARHFGIKPSSLRGRLHVARHVLAGGGDE